MKKYARAILLLLVLCVLSACSTQPEPVEYGKLAYQYVQTLDSTYGLRVAATDGEKTAANYIASEFKDMGYTTEIQPFSYKDVAGKAFDSYNVVAVKKGQTNKTIYLGAHYDARPCATGADDNGSGVAVMLETAYHLQHVQTKNTIIFVAFGSEEMGTMGSAAFVNNLSEDQRANALLMINLDSLIAGDKLYVDAVGDTAQAVADKAINFASQSNIDLLAMPETDGSSIKGSSDHIHFDNVGIDTLFFCATNWDEGNHDGVTQTKKHGAIWNSQYDTLSYIEKSFPGRALKHLEMFAPIIYQTCLTLE